jgi:hypothetical protein
MILTNGLGLGGPLVTRGLGTGFQITRSVGGLQFRPVRREPELEYDVLEAIRRDDDEVVLVLSKLLSKVVKWP